ncbi:hypothetical protein I6H52_04485 [Corynebacterium urealyticum]|uniref:hypothetical protein n=1 Tax=Corynebacterium urealyticum TaxID=43771 RepID=UPI0019109F86|nr:hypothetical protein [Corynebacterium urealyticum]QQE51597.1 hypothetical protein I6H52_04485 [Corynebacterium urealyticum]
MTGLPALVADGGTLTVMRRLATYAWGEYTVTWPDDFTPPDVEEGNTLGYVAHLNNKNPSLSGRRFIRSDVDITATNPNPTPPEPGQTNVEEILDAATNQVTGDAFLEKDITTPGLGRLTPGLHFRVGDRIPIRIFGRILENQLVTAITRTSEPSDTNGYLVHIGGQLTGDQLQLLQRNTEIDRAILAERRERIRAVGAAEHKADRAGRTASTAVAETQQLRDTLTRRGASPSEVTAQLQRLNDQLSAHGESPPGGLIPAILQENALRWRMQEEIDRLQTRQIKDNAGVLQGLQELRERDAAQIREIDALSARLSVLAVGKVTVSGGMSAKSTLHGIALRTPSGDRHLYVCASPDFHGTITVQIFYTNGSGYQKVFTAKDFKYRTDKYDLRRLEVLKDFWVTNRTSSRPYAAYWWVPLGNIDSTTVLVDHTTWNQGVIDYVPEEGED